MITQERLIKVYKKIADSLIRGTKEESAVVGALADYELQSITCDGKPPQIESDRLSLAIAYSSLTATAPNKTAVEFDLKEAVEHYREKVDRAHQRYDKLRSLQLKHGISGVRLESSMLGSQEIPHHKRIEQFVITESDIAVLRSEIPRLFVAWADCGVRLGLEFYQYVSDEKWVKLTPFGAGEQLQDYDYCTIWSASRYLSPGRMRFRGHDEEREAPEYPDDKLFVELNFSLHKALPWGVGERQDQTAWFCACTEGWIC